MNSSIKFRRIFHTAPYLTLRELLSFLSTPEVLLFFFGKACFHIHSFGIEFPLALKYYIFHINMFKSLLRK